MATRSDLCNRAAKKLGVLASGQALDPETLAAFDEEVPALLARLAARRVVYVADADDIPDEWLDQLAALLALQAGPAFSFGTTDVATVKALAVEAERELRTMGSDLDHTDLPVRALYF